MNDLITAAKANDVGRLCQLLDNRKAAQTSSQGLSKEQNSSNLLQEACEAAARNNHPAALEVLLNEGGEIYRCKSFEQLFVQLLDHYPKLIVCRN